MRLRFSIILGVFVVVVATPLAYAVEAPAAVADHMAMANSYDQKAAEQQAVVMQHEQMKEECQERFFVSEKITSQEEIAETKNHCDAIAKAAKDLKEAYSKAAKAHRFDAYTIESRWRRELELENQRLRA